MRKILFVIFVFCFVSSVVFSQANSVLEKAIGVKLETVIETKVTKDVCFNNALTWISGYSTEYTKEIDTSDKGSGTIIAKVKTAMSSTETSLTEYLIYNLYFNMKIDCRDNKYRVTLMNPVVSISPVKHDVNSMGTSSLNKMIDELQTVADITAFKFSNDNNWELIKIINVKDDVNLKIDENKDKISHLDPNNKKDKKELKYLGGKVERLGKEGNIYSELISRTKQTLNKVTNDIGESLNNSDDF